ncbi:MAG: hypothetical protein ACXV8O_09695 [Methylobacter sp.]
MNEQNAILELPVNYFRYLEWHKHSEQRAKRARRTASEGIFEIHEPRFELCLEDVAEKVPDLHTRAVGKHTLIESEHGEIVLDVPIKDINRILDHVDGSLTFNEILDQAHLQKWTMPDNEVLQTVNAMLGVAIVIPSAIDELESAIPGLSIGRFPLSPYDVVRGYWKNMGDLRIELESFYLKGNANEWTCQLRRLHLIALMGADLTSFYKPNSQVSDVTVWPGHFRFDERIHVLLPAEFTGYLKMVAFSLDITLKDQFVIRWEDGGQKWGVAELSGNKASYCPSATPIAGQLEQLCSMLAALPCSVTDANAVDAISALAAFHQRFAQLHPFACANQSVAMNIVNHFLNKWFNTCMPHLYLDMVAFFISADSYARYFARAVKFYSVKINEAQSIYPEFKRRSQRMNQFIPRLMPAAQKGELAEVLGQEPEAARDLLLFD